MEALNITNLTANVNNIQDLSDRPNTTDGLTAQQLKEKFDKAGSDIKQYINLTQNDEIETYMNNVVKPTIEAIQNGEVYSTTEVKTNKVWIDGKPIYRKVLDITNIGVSGYQYNHNISNFGTLIDVYGSWDKTIAGKQPLTRSVPGAINEYDLGIGDVTNTNFRLHYGSSVSGVTHIYVIFEYTKTTD